MKKKEIALNNAGNGMEMEPMGAYPTDCDKNRG